MVWNIMARHENSEDVDDLGVYEIIKSHHGLVIVWCIIPSSGLEIRILFTIDHGGHHYQWQHIYCCRQHQHQYLQHTHSRDRSLSLSTASISSISMNDGGFDRGTFDESDDAVNAVPITRAGYGYNIGAKSFRFKNKREIFKKGLHSEVVRKWEPWTLRIFDRERTPLDESVQQLMVSVALNYENTNSFLSDNWNILDAVVVAVSVVSLTFNLRFWSTLRALRLFRVVIRRPKTRQILSAIKKCIPSLLYTFLMVALLLFIVAVIGLNLFGPAFNGCSCNDVLAQTVWTMVECSSSPGLQWSEPDVRCECDWDAVSSLSQSECTGTAVSWSAAYFRFDNIHSSFFSMFMIARGAEWDYFVTERYCVCSKSSCTFW